MSLGFERLNSRMTYIYVANSVSNFGGILFTPITLTAVVCYPAGPLKFRLSCGSLNVPLHLLNPSTNTDIHVDTS